MGTDANAPDKIQSELDAAQGTSARKHIRGSSMLLLGRLISVALNFGVQVLTVRYLTKSDYGAFAYALNLVSIGASLSLFSLDKAVSRFLPIYEEKKQSPPLFGAILLTFIAIVGLGLAMIVLVFAFQGLLTEKLVDDPLAIKVLLILIVLAPLQALDSWFQSLFAVFARVRAIFFRRYILGPGLKLASVLVVMAISGDVYHLAVGYLIGGLLGLLTYGTMLNAVVQNRPIFREFDRKTLRFPVRDIFGFSGPLMYSAMIFLLRNNLTIMLLAYFHSTTSVAEFRAVVPVARLNEMVLQSFTFLYMPMAARLFARNDKEGINHLYWQTAVWISIMSFPLFAASFALAKPVTILLFGERYADSSVILALLALGYYFNAALGFNADTLRVYGRIKYIVIIDFIVMVAAVVLNLIFISQWGAVGAAVSTAAILIVHNILNHTGLLLGTSIRLFDWHYLRTYATIIVGAAGLLIVQALFSPPIYVGLPLTGLVSLAIVLLNRSVLDVADTFPELLKIPLVKYLFPRTSPEQLPASQS